MMDRDEKLGGFEFRYKDTFNDVNDESKGVHEEFDEIVANNVSFHLEQMDTDEWWIGITDKNGDTTHLRFTVRDFIVEYDPVKTENYKSILIKEPDHNRDDRIEKLENKIDEMAQDNKAMKILFDESHSVVLNMSDTFGFACADAEDMDFGDFHAMKPIIAKYGSDALTAYAAVKRKQEPITCKCNHKNEKYYAAKKEIEELKANPKYASWFLEG